MSANIPCVFVYSSFDLSMNVYSRRDDEAFSAWNLIFSVCSTGQIKSVLIMRLKRPDADAVAHWNTVRWYSIQTLIFDHFFTTALCKIKSKQQHRKRFISSARNNVTAVESLDRLSPWTPLWLDWSWSEDPIGSCRSKQSEADWLGWWCRHRDTPPIWRHG